MFTGEVLASEVGQRVRAEHVHFRELGRSTPTALKQFSFPSECELGGDLDLAGASCAVVQCYRGCTVPKLTGSNIRELAVWLREPGMIEKVVELETELQP
jgi:hypothetical protein